MIALLLANWKSVLAVAATLALCLMLHKLHAQWAEARHAAEIVKVKQAMTAECEKAQAITKGVSNAYQAKLTSLDAKLSSARRLYANRCVAVQGIAAAGHHAATAGKELSGGNAGVAADRLIDLAGRAEKVRLKLIGCQAFISATEGR